jgi:hypothetical protein
MQQALYDKVWFTRKSWIHAEKRLLQNEHHTQLLMVAYSAYTTCLSVILLKFAPTLESTQDVLETGMAVLSIILLALSLYLNSKSFKDRAGRFKVGYHDLQSIEAEVLAACSASTPDMQRMLCIALADRYNKVLRDVENHDEVDDICARISAGSGLINRPITNSERWRYRWWRLWRFVLLTFCYLAPVISILIFILQ